MTSQDLDSAIAAARALGNSARLRAVAMLSGGELCVCQITAVLELAPSTVSLHLKELKRAGLVRERKEGRWVFISLAEDDAARAWIDTAIAAAADDPCLAADMQRVEELRQLPVDDLCRFGYEGAMARRAECGVEVDEE